MKIILITILSSITFLTPAQKFETDKQLLKEFQDMKFGMFVHWGPVSLRGTEIGWSRGREIPIEEYDNLYKKFNPVKFNAEEWIKTLKKAGMKYFIITTKHHDGFSLWPSEYSDYNIASTPYKNDLLMDLKKACDKYGILFGTYYSICDWKYPFYPLGSPAGKTIKEKGGPYKPTDWLTSTRKGNTIYINLLKYNENSLELPFPFETEIETCQLLKGGNLVFNKNNEVLNIELPKKISGELITVLKINISNNANNLTSVALD